MANTGYYSVIQYCPDDSRLESVNIGLAVFCPDIPQVFIECAAHAKRRIEKVFGRQDWEMIESQRRSLEARLTNHADFASHDSIVQFIETRATAVRLSAPRFLKFTRPAQEEFARLFSRLVSAPPKGQRAPAVTGFLRKALQESGVKGFVRQRVRVTIPKLNKPLCVPFAYQNGRYNLIRPEQFALSTEDSVFEKASLIAVEGQYLFEEPDPQFQDMKLVVVANFGVQHERESAVQDIMRRHNVTLYTFDQLGPLIEDIRSSAAKHHPGF